MLKQQSGLAIVELLLLPDCAVVPLAALHCCSYLCLSHDTPLPPLLFSSLSRILCTLLSLPLCWCQSLTRFGASREVDPGEVSIKKKGAALADAGAAAVAAFIEREDGAHCVRQLNLADNGTPALIAFYLRPTALL